MVHATATPDTTNGVIDHTLKKTKAFMHTKTNMVDLNDEVKMSMNTTGTCCRYVRPIGGAVKRPQVNYKKIGFRCVRSLSYCFSENISPVSSSLSPHYFTFKLPLLSLWAVIVLCTEARSLFICS